MKQLTKEIINKDLKEIRKKYIFMSIAAVIIICYGGYELFKNISKDDLFLILFPCILILFGIVCFINSLLKYCALKGKYTIRDGYVENVFYDQSKNICKISINGLKGIIITPDNFLVGENVFVVCYKSKALMCYSKKIYII